MKAPTPPATYAKNMDTTPTLEAPLVTEGCRHCRQPVDAGQTFCCDGCRMVYGLLSSSGLGDYYTLRDRLGTVRAPQPARMAQSLKAGSFAYLDDPSQIQPLHDAEGKASLDFYLEGVHCAACVWLIEKLPEFLPQVASARLNLANATVRVSLRPARSGFAAVAATLAAWGYTPHLVQRSADAEALARREQRLLLSRIGVAAFAAGNLMILAVALYAGITGPLARYFEWLSLLLAAPAVSFSAWPFYRQAWSQLVHQHRISIDVPIALSLLLGTLGGVWELIWGSRQIYFDSLAMLVFLLLFSRYALLRAQQHVLRQDRLLAFYTPETVDRREADGGFVSVELAALAPDDTLRIREGSRIPADGVILAGQASLDQSVLTGEAYPQPALAGESVYCGTRLAAGELLMRVTALGADTRLGSILQKSQANLEAKTQLVRLADRLARRFVVVVLGLSGLLALLFAAQPQTALVRVLALAIISCPCALALATPLMVQMALKQALARGYFVRKAESLERLPDARTIVFDKTGTLTQGRFELLEAHGLDAESRAAVLALEALSVHPIARALQRSLPVAGPLPLVEDFKVLPAGIAGTIAGTGWQIVPDAGFDGAGVRLEVRAAGHLRGVLVLGDRLRPEAPAILASLRQAGYSLWLLSGDQPAACAAVALAAGIEADQVLACQTPEAKEAFLRAHPDAIMVGDGINDMLAMSRARVGISVQGSAEENLQSADIYLAEAGIGQLPGLLRHARETRRLLKLALGFSLTYNLLGVTAAMLGFVTPLVAAILMPLSALTVISIVLAGGQRLCRF